MHIFFTFQNFFQFVMIDFHRVKTIYSKFYSFNVSKSDLLKNIYFKLMLKSSYSNSDSDSFQLFFISYANFLKYYSLVKILKKNNNLSINFLVKSFC